VKSTHYEALYYPEISETNSRSASQEIILSVMETGRSQWSKIRLTAQVMQRHTSNCVTLHEF